MREDQKNFRKIVLNRKIDHWQRSNKMILEHIDVKRMIRCLRTYGIKEPYATNIVMRVFMASWEVIEKTK